MKCYGIRALIMMMLLFLSYNATSAEEDPSVLIFGTAPTSSAEETNKLYADLIRYLGKTTGRNIKLAAANNYMEYQVKMRQGAYDLMFDGPPFVSWRMKNQQHIPLVSLPSVIKMVVVVHEGFEYKTVDEVSSHNISTCTIPSPNTLTLIFLSYFPNPARQPNLIPIEGYKNVEECLRSGRGEIAVLRDSYWKKMDKTGLKVLFEPSAAYPERTITAGPKVPDEVKQKIVDALTSEEGAAISKELLARFQRDKFIKANPDDYAGLDRLLLPVWGFN